MLYQEKSANPGFHGQLSAYIITEKKSGRFFYLSESVSGSRLHLACVPWLATLPSRLGCRERLKINSYVQAQMVESNTMADKFINVKTIGYTRMKLYKYYKINIYLSIYL
jgi:hypothetical protein